MVLKRISVLLLFLFLAKYLRTTAGMAVMSIDMGSEYMKIALVKPGVPMEIVLNKESRRKTPVAISLKSVEREFGDPALTQAIKHPKTAYFQLRDLLGKSLDNPLVKSFQQKYPFYDIKEDPVTKTIYFQHDSETKYTPEEIMSMILDNARELASDYAEQKVDTAVITVPPYFTQTERKALLRAAELANIKVIQLINTNAATALNYGVFRRKDFNSSEQTMIFFDMGSSGTTVSVVTYQMVKGKDDFEPNPQLTVRGVGFDRTLGGSEFTYRLMKHLAAKFKAEKKKDVFTNPKALLKLYKEAERVKTVLSANNDHMAQIEGLIDDIDMKIKVTREEFESICSDLFDRIQKPIEDAINSAGIILDEVQTVLLMGAGTRTPRVQSELLKVTKKTELGKNMNTDEAAALGAVYQAAYQSKGYKVKKFYVKDANMYPIAVDFERHQLTEGGHKEAAGIVRRVLFDRNNIYPQKKIMTFNKHHSDFSFSINYADLSSFDEAAITVIGSLNISKVDLAGVTEVFEKHKDEESKGIKVHFNMDESGLFQVDKIDIVFEKIANESEDESTLSKIGNKISSFFGGGSADNADEKAREDDEKSGNEEKPEGAKEESKSETGEKASDSNTTANATQTDDNAAKNETKPVVKSKATKEKIQFTTISLGLPDADEAVVSEIKKKLELIKQKEQDKRKRASAVNNLESFIYDAKDKFQQDDFVKCSTQDERDNVVKSLEEANEWLFDADDSVETKVFTDKLSELKNLAKDVVKRVNERKLRPKRLADLKEILNVSSHFLATIRNETGEDKPFTEVEVTALEKLINTTIEWRSKMLTEQGKLADYEAPKLLSADIADKIDALRREVNYLISKAKYFKPKPKATPKANTTKTEETKEDAGKEDAGKGEKAEKEPEEEPEPEEEKAQEQEPEQKQQQTEQESEQKQQQTEQEPEINIEDIFKDESVPKRKPKPTRETDTPNADENLELGEDKSETPRPEL